MMDRNAESAAAKTPPLHLSKPVVMVGLMGAGKSRIGRELAAKLKYDFIDADDEIIRAAGCSISDIFEMYGEDAFRDVEMKVITRLLDGPPRIIATGGGAFMNESVRQKIAANGISIWLKADIDILVERTGRRQGRPLLDNGDPKAVLEDLMKQRYPVYDSADIAITSRDVPINETVEEVEAALENFLISGKPQRDTAR